MLSNSRALLNSLLTKTASALDIPDEVYEDATLKYEDVGSWLAAEDSELRDYTPQVYVQGSFRLGTVVHPMTEADEYDIDLVCQMQIGKEQTTQARLKEIVGDRLKKREDLAKILEPSRRCWMLDYVSSEQMPQFHMDVLPAIANPERPPTGILLTDTELRLWQKSNPIAFADWFHGRMSVVFNQQRAVLAESLQLQVEEVPEWQVKTPLQIAVQILKRHRDIHFRHQQEIRPVSIIITTLAAQAYRNQLDVYEALAGILQEIEMNWGKRGFVENRNGKWWVVNPVDPDENFADRWNEYPERREAFMQWVKKVRCDFAAVVSKTTMNEAVDVLAPVLGNRAINKAAQDLGISVSASLPALVRPLISVPVLGNTGHCLPVQWPVQLTYEARVNGAVYFKRHARKKLWDLTDRPVPKGIWLRFSVKTNVPPPYDVSWQVVNSGLEASTAGQLRGDFYGSDTGTNDVRWESTSYAGTHWVEAFIIKNGVCLARTGRKYVRVR